MSTPPRLIVVDDEVDFATTVCRVATMLGYEARAVQSGAALRVVYAEFQPTDLVLDIVMPEEDGIEVLGWIADQACKPRVILASGYNPHYASTARTLGAAKGVEIAAVLRKPVELAELREILAQGASAAGGGARSGAA